MGLGVTGLANAAEMLGYSYGSKEFMDFTSMVLETLRDEAYSTSADLAEEKGSFPLYQRDFHLTVISSKHCLSGYRIRLLRKAYATVTSHRLHLQALEWCIVFAHASLVIQYFFSRKKTHVNGSIPRADNVQIMA